MAWGIREELKRKAAQENNTQGEVAKWPGESVRN